MDKSAESLGEALEQCASIPGVTPISPRVVGRMRVFSDIEGLPGVVLLDAAKTLPPGDYELVARAHGVNPCEAPSITDDAAVTLAIGVGGALFSGNAGNERTYIMSRSDIGRFARAVQKGSTAGVSRIDAETICHQPPMLPKD